MPHIYSRCVSLLLLLCLSTTTMLAVGTVVAGTVPRLTQAEQHRATERVIQHHAFTPPLLRSYFGEGELQHWATAGVTVVTDHYVRLTPDRASQVGHLWNTVPLDMPAFEVIVGFHIHAQHGGGADGFGLWITRETPQLNGPLMGRPMKFTGLGVIFDTYDNDGMRDNPAVYVLFNDEGNSNREYHPQRDYKGEYLGSCQYNFRQSSQYLSTVRLLYMNNILQVFLSRSSEEDETLCTTVRDLRLDTDKKDYYIGLSAETGTISDNHDIIFVHTMPVKGQNYGHNVYETSTPIAESDQHTEQNAQNEYQQRQQEEQQRQQQQQQQQQQQRQQEEQQQRQQYEQQQQQRQQQYEQQQQQQQRQQEQQQQQQRQQEQQQQQQRQQEQQQQQQRQQEQQQQRQQQQQQQEHPEPQGGAYHGEQAQGDGEEKRAGTNVGEHHTKQDSRLNADQLRLIELERQLEEMRLRQRSSQHDRLDNKGGKDHDGERRERGRFNGKEEGEEQEEDEEDDYDYDTPRKTAKRGTHRNRREHADGKDTGGDRGHEEEGEEGLDERHGWAPRYKRAKFPRGLRKRRLREEQ